MSFHLMVSGVKNVIRVVLLFSFSGMAIAVKSDTQIVGRIKGEITVNADGSLKAVSLSNVKHEKLNVFLIENIKAWQFHPMKINGKPVESTNGFSFDAIATTGPNNQLKKILLSDIEIEKSELEAKFDKQMKANPRPLIYYPIEARYGDAEAKIKVAVDITSDGKVKNADVTDIQIMNTDNPAAIKLSNSFARNALRGVQKWTWTPEQLKQNNCFNGCVGLIKVDFVKPGSGFWKIYQHIPQAPIPWVVASELKDMNESNKSQLVRLKDDPTEKTMEIGG